MDPDVAIATVLLGKPLVTVGGLCGAQLAHPGAVKASSTRALEDFGTLIFRDRSLDLQQ